MNAPEVWLPVVGYEGLYSVSSHGRVRSEAKPFIRSTGHNYVTKPRIMRPACGKDAPYLSLGLSNESGRTTHYVHHLVLNAFVGPKPDGTEACHGDGDPKNNRKTNLRWDTRPGNFADKKVHGTGTVGERHPQAKLDAQTVLEMRRRVAEGAPPSGLGKEFGISRMTAYRAATGRSWSHL